MSHTRREWLQETLAGSLVLHAGALALSQEPRRDPPPSPFLEGNFAPVREETVAANLRVIGRLPRELNGMFVRNGPNPQFTPRGRYHWFDGDAMIHGVHIREGRASYLNRYVRTAGWQEENRAGRAVFTGLLEPPDLLRAVQGGTPYKNAANTALVWYNGRLLALWEGGDPHALRLPDLTTQGTYNFGGRLRHPFTAHPKIDPQTGDMMFFGYSPLRPFLSYAVANARGEIVHATTIDLPRAVMMHDFAITERHALFLDLPVTLNLERLVRNEAMMRYEPDLGARIGVLPRRGQGRDIRWFPIQACYVFHTLNAYEDGDEVILHGCRMTSFPDVIASGRQQAGERAAAPVLHEWRLNLRTNAVRERDLDEVACEFPRLREDRMGRRHRFGYAGKANGFLFDGLLKFDLQNGRCEQHLHGRDRFGGEGIFVPHPDCQEEDAGWLLTYIHDQREARSEVVVVDTRDFRAAPIARIQIPTRVPYGFHGTWVPSIRFAS
jgi:carotenoid cleavage dioxygenase